MTVKDQVVPDDHGRRMLLEQLLEFMRCPFLYRLKWLEGRQSGPKGYPESVFRRAAFWACMSELLNTYGLKAGETQIRAVSQSVILQRRAKASDDLVRGITDLVWNWWQDTLTGVDEVLHIDTPFSIHVKELGGTWDVCGTVPLVIREPGRPQPTVILPLVDYPTVPEWIENDLLVPVTLAGAKLRFQLPIRTIRVQALGHGVTTILGNRATVTSQEPEIDSARIERALQVLGAVRQSVLSSLWGSTWWPNRQATTCRRSQCPFTAHCIQTFGGTVAP